MAENKDNTLTLQFIEDYKNYECLWNTNLISYTNKNVRNEALRALDTKYRLGGIKAVKNKIKCLRSYFAKEYGKYLKKTSGTGADETYVPPWFAYKHLLFLKDTYTQETQKNMKKIAGHTVDAKQERSNEVINDNANAMERPTPSGSFTSEVTMPPHKKRKLNESKKTPPEEDIEEKKTRRFTDGFPDKITLSEEYSIFGNYIGQKIRNLPTSDLRSIAEHRISNILFELEMLPVSKYDKIYSSSSSSCSDSPTPFAVDSASEEED